MKIIGRCLAALALAACAPQPPPPRMRPEIAPGELVIHTRDATLLTTQRLAATVGRDDFSVRQVSCFLETCRVRVERTGAATTEDWTYALVDAIRAARVPGIAAVEAAPVR